MKTITLAYLVFGDTLHVLGAPRGSIRHLRPIGVFTPDWAAVRAARDRIRTQMHHAADSGELAAAALGEVRGLCAYLFDELVPLEAKRWLRNGSGSLSLSLPPELLDLPWELLHTGNGFLSLEWAMGRVVQLADDPEPSRELLAYPPRVLVVADPDGELHEAYDEGMALQARLRTAVTGTVAFRAGDVDAAFLRRHARDYDIVHYAGHIDPDGWRMSESKFSRDAIRMLSGAAPLPGLVFANGCAGAEGPDFDSSMLEAWLASGVQHVLGPLFDVPDRLGRLFSLEFYGALTDGASVGEAVRCARCALAREFGEGTTPWGAYVLYGEPDQRYFDSEVTRPLPLPSTPTGPTRLRHTEPPSAEATRRPPSLESATLPARRPRFGDPVFALILLVIALLAAAAIAIVVSPGPNVQFVEHGEQF